MNDLEIAKKVKLQHITDIAKKFGITSIPATFLIGKDGKVVASNLRGPALEKAVKKELGL